MNGSASAATTWPLVDSRVFRQRVRQRIGIDGILMRGLITLFGAWLCLFLILPLLQVLLRSLQSKTGEFVGLANYIAYFSNPTISWSLGNSLYISIISTMITVGLALVYAYALARTTLPGRGVLRTLAMLPIFAPSLMQALAFIYIFGNNGIFTRLSGINIRLYGSTGIIMSEVFYAFPHALIILIAALSLADARLYEAAQALGASSTRIFFTVTLPSIRYGLISAMFVVFTLAITDFGAPKVVGGDYDVLATDIYNKVIGQQDFGMGATISVVLLIPAVLAFVIDRIVQRRQIAQVTASITPLGPKRHGRVVQAILFAYSLMIVGFILGVYGVVMVGAFVRNWPYDFSLTLKHFDFYSMGGYRVLWNSLQMATITAIVGTILVFCSAYLIEKTKVWAQGRSAVYLLSIVPLAIPGTVLGLAYIFSFNDPRSPFNSLYGTMAILAISTIIHYYTVPYLTATTALKQIDPEFEAIGASLDAPFYRTFWRVTVPMALPAIISIAMYFFLNAMVTISAVVFLFVPGKELAALAVMLLDDSGESAQAMAMSLLIISIGLSARVLFYLLTRGIEWRSQAWTRR